MAVFRPGRRGGSLRAGGGTARPGRRLIAGTVAVLVVIAVIAAVTHSVALGGIPVVAALFAGYWAPTVTAYRLARPERGADLSDQPVPGVDCGGLGGRDGDGRA